MSKKVYHRTGGAKDIFKEALAFSRVNEQNRFFILDGDQKTWTDPIDLGTIGDAQLNDKIFSLTSINATEFQWVADGGAIKEKQLITEKRKYLQYLNDFFAFLPGKSPEDTIIQDSLLKEKPDWNEETGETSKDALEKWVKTKIDTPSASDISTFQKILLQNIGQKHKNVKAIEKIIESFLSRKNPSI